MGVTAIISVKSPAARIKTKLCFCLASLAYELNEQLSLYACIGFIQTIIRSEKTSTVTNNIWDTTSYHCVHFSGL